MSQETSEDKQQTQKPGSGAADSGSARPKGPPRPAGSTTIRPRPTTTGPRSPINRPGGPGKKGFGVELVMGLVLLALVLGIGIVFLATSATSTPQQG